MARQGGPFIFEGTINDLIFYKMDGKGYVRMKPCLPDIRKSPRFRRTMKSARWLGRASKIGAVVYATLPEGYKQFPMYRAFVGEAMYMLKAGKTDRETMQVLLAKQEDLMNRSTKIVSMVYNALAVCFKQEWMYWAFVEEAMALLKEGKTNEEAERVLWAYYAAEFESGYDELKEFVHPVPVMKKAGLVSRRPVRKYLKIALLPDNKIIGSYSFGWPRRIGRISRHSIRMRAPVDV